MKALKLTRGKYAVVDDDIYEIVNKYNWYCMARGEDKETYAVRNLPREKGKLQKKLYLHKFIMDNPNSMVDHKDGDTLNNQRSNLRLCNIIQNGANSKIQKNNKSGFRGASFNKREQKYECRVGKLYFGRYKNPIEAAKLYDINAKEIYGEFARTNF